MWAILEYLVNLPNKIVILGGGWGGGDKFTGIVTLLFVKYSPKTNHEIRWVGLDRHRVLYNSDLSGL